MPPLLGPIFREHSLTQPDGLSTEFKAPVDADDIRFNNSSRMIFHMVSFARRWSTGDNMFFSPGPVGSDTDTDPHQWQGAASTGCFWDQVPCHEFHL